MEQETLEEAFDRIFDSIDYILFDFTSFEQGAKWQQERSYSEEEVLNILYEHTFYLFGEKKHLLLEEWFEQFKKK